MASQELNEGGGEAPFAVSSEKLVLIVDDDEGQRDLLEYIVSKEGFRVEKVASGDEALARVSTTAPDLILLDLMMPGKGGYEVVRELQAQGEGGIPVVVITARSMDKKTIEGLRQEPNVKDYFQKPPQHAVLAARLHSLLGTRPAA